MSKQLNNLKRRLLETFIKTPILARFSRKWYSLLGVELPDKSYIAPDVKVIGDYSNIKLSKNASIYPGGMLVTRNKITIGENTAIAYQVLILTSSNPRGPLNKLEKIYKKVSKPVVIGNNCWIGARATIFPGVTIGDFCVVAAGSVVTKDVPDYTVVAGVPAKEVKKLDKNMLL